MTDEQNDSRAQASAGPLAQDLLRWFAREGRDLPWRRTRDPYRIWLSEVMLIQTQVPTVIPYYERFLELFPDVAALAAAPLDEVLKAWEGLGYYARARHLHQAAKRVVAHHGGELPRDPAALRALPGVGEYTAGALLSIAFGRDEPALDGNVRRVISRLYHVTGAPDASATQARLRELVQAILPGGAAGAWNQALMDLGSMVCTPRQPRCAACPLSGHCEAYRRGAQEAVPERRRRRQTPHYDVAAAVAWQGERVLIAQRPIDGLLGGLWGFPAGKQEPGETLSAGLAREIRRALGIEIQVGAPVTTVEHAYSHFSITLHAFHCRLLRGEPQAIGCAAWRWAHLDELEQYAFSVADRKVIAALTGTTGHCG